MTTGKKVILARPHPMLAGAMTRFLTENGYAPSPLGEAAQLSSGLAGLSGAVISTAAASSIRESPVDILALLKAHHPNVPVLFATLVEPAKMIDSLSREFSRKGWTMRLLAISPETERDAGLGHQETGLMVHNKDLEQPERLALLGRIVRRHFG